MTEPLEPAAVARLQVEHERSTFELKLLKAEVERLAASHRRLEVRLVEANGELASLRAFKSAVEGSLPWRVIQRLRRVMGREW